MKTSLGLVLALLACLATAEDGEQGLKKVFFKDVPRPPVGKESDPTSRIFGGNVAARTQFPYQAGIYLDFQSFCGGSLISKQWVLTAGHCVSGFTKWAVFLGVSNMLHSKQDGREVFISNKGIRHENYNSRLIYNDIAVIQLKREVKLNEFISLVKLAPAGINYAGRTATISGFGMVDDGDVNVISPVLKYTSMPIVSNAVCGQAYSSYGESHPSVICLEAKGTSSCSGDSGGPLVLNDDDGDLIQIGITSFGANRGCSYGFPVGYTRVNYFIDWLSKTTGLELP